MTSSSPNSRSFTNSFSSVISGAVSSEEDSLLACIAQYFDTTLAISCRLWKYIATDTIQVSKKGCIRAISCFLQEALESRRAGIGASQLPAKLSKLAHNLKPQINDIVYFPIFIFCCHFN